MGITIAQLKIDDSSNRDITGTNIYRRTDGGVFIPPSGPTFPDDPRDGEWFWNTSDSVAYVYDEDTLTWIAEKAGLETHGATHGTGGTDPVTLAQNQVTGLVGTLVGKLSTDHITEEVGPHDRLTNTMSTGIIRGGILSINAGDDTKFDVTAGMGVVVNNYTDPENPERTLVEWGDLFGITDEDIALTDETYIGVDINGNIIQSSSDWADEQRRDVITLGWTSHLVRDVIEEIHNEPHWACDVNQSLNDFFENFGAFNIEGNDYCCCNLLTLGRTAGKTFDSGLNWQNSRKSPNVVITNSESGINFVYYYRDAFGEWVNNGPEITDIDPDQWDTGTGLAAVPMGEWSIQTILFYAGTSATDVQYGQKTYATKELALSGVNDLVIINPYHKYNTFRAWLVVKQGATDLANTDEAVFVPAGKLGLVSIAAGGGSGGEVNTASNVGLSGTGLYRQKLGTDLQFKNIRGSIRLSVTANEGQQTVDLDVVPDQISHTEIDDIGANTHAEIDVHIADTTNPHGVTKTQVGLSDVTNDAQLKRSANDFSTFDEKSPVASADLLLIEDSAAAGVKKRIQIGNLPAGSSIFGSDFQLEESLAESSTTSNVFQDKVTLTTGALTGVYRVAFCCELESGSAPSRGPVRLYNVTDDVELCLHDARITQSSIFWTITGFTYVTFTGALKTFKLQWRSFNNSTEFVIKNARIEFWRVS